MRFFDDARHEEWRRWFAWYPVWCYESRCTAWLETVERRGEHVGPRGISWDYRLVKFRSEEERLRFVAGEEE